MTLQSSGAISLADIASEFGGSTPHSLSEYYEGHSGIPSSGTISMSQFYGTSSPSYVYASGGSVSQSGNYGTHYFYSSGYFNITNSGVDTNQIADDAVTNAKLSTNGETVLGNSTLTLGATTTDIGGLTSLVVDDITINGQTLSTTSANKDVNINPHGTGTVKVPAG